MVRGMTDMRGKSAWLRRGGAGVGPGGCGPAHGGGRVPGPSARCRGRDRIDCPPLSKGNRRISGCPPRQAQTGRGCLCVASCVVSKRHPTGASLRSLCVDWSSPRIYCGAGQNVRALGQGVPSRHRTPVASWDYGRKPSSPPGHPAAGDQGPLDRPAAGGNRRSGHHHRADSPGNARIHAGRHPHPTLRQSGGPGAGPATAPQIPSVQGLPRPAARAGCTCCSPTTWLVPAVCIRRCPWGSVARGGRYCVVSTASPVRT